jgi:hypothetical protein
MTHIQVRNFFIEYLRAEQPDIMAKFTYQDIMEKVGNADIMNMIFKLRVDRTHPVAVLIDNWNMVLSAKENMECAHANLLKTRQYFSKLNADLETKMAKVKASCHCNDEAVHLHRQECDACLNPEDLYCDEIYEIKNDICRHMEVLDEIMRDIQDNYSDEEYVNETYMTYKRMYEDELYRHENNGIERNDDYNYDYDYEL